MAKTGNEDNDTPVQPDVRVSLANHRKQWGQQPEIPAGVKNPWSCAADSRLVTSLPQGVGDK